MQAPLIRKGIREQVQGIGMWERVQAAAGGWMGGLSASLKLALSGGAEVGGAIVGEIAENIDDVASKTLKTQKPNQMHHYATNKNQTYTPQFQKIADK